MADLVSMGDAVRRAADALLRGTGGRVLLLRVPLPAVAGDVTEQVGLATPGFEDVELAPAVFRKSRARMGESEAAQYEVLVSAACIEALAGAAGQSVDVMFAQAFGVLAGDAILRIESVTGSEVSGAVYAYRLLLRGALVDAV